MKTKNKMNLLERAQSPTPKFFQHLRNFGLAIAALGGAILTAPVAVPAVVSTAAGYIAVLGGALSAVSQVTVNEK